MYARRASVQEGLGLRDIRGLRIPRRPDVNPPTLAGPTHHPPLEGFHRQVAREIINVHVGSAIAVEAVNRNRTDPFSRMLARSIGGPGSDFDGVYAIEFRNCLKPPNWQLNFGFSM
jgi:hypothetical protein